jgi:hypothetical protein
MCIACEMDFWIISEELAPPEPAADFTCDAPEQERAEPMKPPSDARE